MITRLNLDDFEILVDSETRNPPGALQQEIEATVANELGIPMRLAQLEEMAGREIELIETYYPDDRCSIERLENLLRRIQDAHT